MSVVAVVAGEASSEQAESSLYPDQDLGPALDVFRHSLSKN